GIRDFHVTGVQTCALPISLSASVGSPATVSTSTRQLSVVKYSGRRPSSSSRSSSSNDASAASYVYPCASRSLTRLVTRVSSSPLDRKSVGEGKGVRVGGGG